MTNEGLKTAFSAEFKGRLWTPFTNWGKPVGTFTSPLRLDSLDGTRSLQLNALVDTGASYTIVASGLLRELGVPPSGEVELVLADGRRAVYAMGEARATLDGRSIPTIVVFGDDGAEPLLGAYTLEGLRLAVDPANLRLVPLPYARA